MNIRFGKHIYLYFTITMFTLLGLLGAGTYLYWTKGAANIENIAEVFESAVQLDTLEKKGGMKKVSFLIRQDRVREAISFFDDLILKVDHLNSLENVKEYNDLKKNSNFIKNDLNKLLSASSRSTLINVLRVKIGNFQDFVVHNEWRTLTRVAKKINGKMSARAVRSQDFFTYRKFSRFHKSIGSDIKYMEAVTTASVLSREDKNLILIKLGTLKTEMMLIGKSVKILKGFNKSFSLVNKSFPLWLKAIGPTLASKKIKLIKSSQYILYALVAGIALICALLCVGYFVYIVGSKVDKEKVEAEVLKVVKEGLIPVQAKLSNEWSLDFKEDLDKFREYIHKRMSFGSIFQDAMPFSSILLDSNLNMVWANSLFYEHWSIEKKDTNDKNMTWDYLQRFTNLGENDPVITAAKNNIAGIYQIQVKTEGIEEAAPFEMYVSPVEYAGQKRIMVIFYPLRSLEETLGDQMKSLVSPVSRTLDALLNNQYKGEFIERVQNDFEAGGIGQINKKFSELNDFYTQQRMGLLNEIESLETSLFNQYNIMDDVKIAVAGQKELQKDTINKFSLAKEHIISVVDLRGQFEMMVTDISSLGENLFEEELALLSKATEVTEVMQENTKAIETLVKSRDDFKKLKSQVETFRSRVSHILETSRKSDWSVNKSAQGLQRLKTELMDFENVLTAFSRVSTSLDVGLSKVQIIMQSKKLPDVSSSKRKFESLRSNMEEISMTAQKVSRLGQEKDEELIKSLKGLFLGFQNLRMKSSEIEALIPVGSHDLLCETSTFESSQEIGPV